MPSYCVCAHVHVSENVMCVCTHVTCECVRLQHICESVAQVCKHIHVCETVMSVCVCVPVVTALGSSSLVLRVVLCWRPQVGLRMAPAGALPGGVRDWACSSRVGFTGDVPTVHSSGA